MKLCLVFIYLLLAGCSNLPQQNKPWKIGYYFDSNIIKPYISEEKFVHSLAEIGLEVIGEEYEYEYDFEIDFSLYGYSHNNRSYTQMEYDINYKNSSRGSTISIKIDGSPSNKNIELGMKTLNESLLKIINSFPEEIKNKVVEEYQTKHPIYEGYAVMGFESYQYIPCNDDNSSWFIDINSTPRVIENYSKHAIREYNPVYMKVRGSLSELGRYGHLGGNERKVEIVEVLKVGNSNKGKCDILGYWKEYLE